MSTYEYTYFDYLENAYEGYYDYYYESIYWPAHYGPDYNGTYPPSPYEFVHPKMELINPFLYAFIIIMAIVSVVIAAFAFYKIFTEKCNQPKSGNAETDKVVLVLTLFCLTVHLGQNLTSTVLYYYMYIAFEPAFSFDVLLVWDLFFCLTRVSIYALFIYRFYLIFQAQKLLYPTSSCYQCGVFAVSALIMVVQCTFYVLYVIVFYGYSDLGHPDILTLWKSVYWAFLALDFVFIGVLGYLLSKSVLKVIVDLQNLSKKPNPMDAVPTTTFASGSSGSSGATKAEVNLAQYVDNTGTKTHDIEFDLSTSAGSTSGSDGASGAKSKELGGDLIRLATKIALLVLVSMLSSFVYQFVWMLSYEFGDLHLLLFSYTWCFDGVTNMICIYLSLSVAKAHYKKLCFDVCKCHQCALKCITTVAHVETMDI